MKTLIKNGRLIDPRNRVDADLNLLIEGGRVIDVTDGEPAADRVIDAGGRVVAPGFIDIHMHEDVISPDGRLYKDEKNAIFNCMLRMGVTTVLAGECGSNCCEPADYLDAVDEQGAAVNVAMLAGQGWIRAAAGHTDKYTPATEAEQLAMQRHIAEELDRGCFGVSYGIRYVPGLGEAEIMRCAEPCRRDGRLIAAHIRSDAGEVFEAGREFMDIGLKTGLPVELSHIGSMAGFGQMREFLGMVAAYRERGLDVSCDCYPYYAFSTGIGETTYDEGWLERYDSGYEVIEMAEGRYRGQRLNKERFEEMRREHPEYLTIGHLMKPEDVDIALSDPNVMLCSDGILSRGSGHPRAAGSNPKLFAGFVRTGKLTMYRAVEMMTSMPAARLGLKNKGCLNIGADADIVILDPGRIQDRATFAEPVLPPLGIDYVLIGGRIAAENCKIVDGDLGRSLRR